MTMIDNKGKKGINCILKKDYKNYKIQNISMEKKRKVNIHVK